MPSKLFIIAIILFNSINFYSQGKEKDSIQEYFNRIDELIKNRANFKNDFLDENALILKKDNSTGKDKIYYLLRLYKINKYKSVDKAYKYNQEALELSKEINFKNGEYSAKANHAYLHFTNGLFEKAMNEILEVEKEINYTKYPNCYADIKTIKSYIHTERGEYDLALDIGLKQLDQAEKSKNQYALMKAYLSISHYYLRIENYKTALSYCLKGLDCVIKLRDLQYLFPKIDEIARMSAKLNNIEQAKKAYEFYLKLENEIYSPGSFIQSAVYMNIADISIHNNDLEKAQNYLSQALKMNVENNYRFRIPRALILQAELNLKTKDTINAILNYEKSIQAAEEINAFDVVKSNSAILINLYQKQNNFAKVFEYKTLYTAIKDSLFTNEKEQKIVILEARRKIKEITQTQKILKLENKAQKTRIQTIIAFLFLIIFICISILFSYLKVKQKNKLLYLKTIELAKIQLNMSKKLNKIKKSEILLTPELNDDKTPKSSNEIDDSTKNIILNKLENFEKELFFINQECTLNKLAKQLKTNPKYLSQVINQEKKSNFTCYINELRINHLLARLLTEKDFRESKLSYIAASIGYNNSNTFNTAFKKRQGILPSYFIQELIEDLK